MFFRQKHPHISHSGRYIVVFGGEKCWFYCYCKRTGRVTSELLQITKGMSIIVQQDMTIYSFIIFSADSSTCFGRYPHPSSGAHSNCN